MVKGLSFCLVLLFTSNLFSQNAQPVNKNINNYSINNPLDVPEGIIFTNSDNSAIYLEQNNVSELLIESPVCGSGYKLSDSGETIGFKYIDCNGNQIPFLYNLSNKKIIGLSSTVENARQVSFATNGLNAFTIGNQLIVHSGNSEKKYDLGIYSNLAPISPDAVYAAFSDNNDQIYLINLDNGIKRKITVDTCGFYFPKWSPNGTKLLYSSLSGILKVYDLKADKSYFIGQGFSPSWSHDSQLIVFYRKEINNLESINSDIFVSSGSAKMNTRYAEWNPNLSKDGFYKDYAYIPYNDAEEAIYKINLADGIKENIANQTEYENEWTDLGKYQFNKRTDGYVRLGDPSSIGGQPIIVDAVKWTYADSIETDVANNNISLPNNFSVEQNNPNPFNLSFIIKYSVPKSSLVSLKIYDILGNEISNLINKQESAGIYEVNFNASKLVSGIYPYKLQADQNKLTRKMLL